MKIKWNWGTKLFMWTGLYILLVISFIVVIMNQNIDLVEKDYYPKGLRHQKEIDKRQNTASLNEKVDVKRKDGNIIIQFQSFFEYDKIHGTINIYRPSNSKLDINLPIQTNNLGIMKISMDKMYKGRYIVKMNYSYDGISYYQEKSIFI